MSFGFDNEVLLSTVYHPCWPLAEQIGADEDTRRLPSGLDLAYGLGNGYARSLLRTDLSEYPQAWAGTGRTAASATQKGQRQEFV